MPRPTAEWLDAQYNNLARVADSAVLLDRWARASQMVREGVPCTLDIPYGEHASSKLDVFTTDVEKAPVLVFIHGGWWRALDKSDQSFMASACTDAGAMVVIPNYALCPGVSMEHIPMQLTQVLAWVWRHASDHGGDPNRIFLAGHSAGGHLATMLACCDWKAVAPDLPRRLIKGVMTVSGVHELAAIRNTPFLQRDLQLDAQSVRRLSPVNFPAPPNTPIYAVVGAEESEEFRRQNQAIRKAWGARAVPICEEIAGSNHFTILHDLVDPQGRSHELLRHLMGLRWYSGLHSAVL